MLSELQVNKFFVWAPGEHASDILFPYILMEGQISGALSWELIQVMFMLYQGYVLSTVSILYLY